MKKIGNFIFQSASNWECLENYIEVFKLQLKDYVDAGVKNDKSKDIMKSNIELVFKYLSEKMGL